LTIGGHGFNKWKRNVNLDILMIVHIVFGFYSTNTPFYFSSDMFGKEPYQFFVLFCSKPKAHTLTPKVKKKNGRFGMGYNKLLN
jgi:hypothetical protein